MTELTHERVDLARRPAYRQLREAFDTALVDGQLGTCDMCTSSCSTAPTNAREFAEIHDELTALVDCPVGQEQWRHGLSVYDRLSAQGGAYQRSVKHADLLIAAAEAAGVTVVNYDEDYDHIAEITGQRTRWLAPAGTLR